MFTTLALFALFTIGSADEGCGVGTSPTHCVNSGNVGTCTGTTCGGFDSLCTAIDKGDYCGKEGLAVGKCEATNSGKCKTVKKACTTNTGACRTADNLVGSCGGNSPNFTCTEVAGCSVANATCQDTSKTVTGRCNDLNKCEYTETVQVAYTVRVDRADEIQNQTVAKELLKLEHSLKCPPGQNPAASNPANALSVDCPQEAGSYCVVKCGTDKSVKGMTRMCSEHGQWQGTLGSCDESCPIKSTDNVIPATGVFERALESGFGKIVCASAFDNASCKLECNAGYRKTVETAYKCDFNGGSANTWNGAANNAAPGTCALLLNLLGSTNVVLAHNDKYNKITNLADPAFNKKIRDQIATITGVEEWNVTVTAITTIPVPPFNRRLNETTVKVDYTIQAGKDDPAGRLLVGGPLRGVR